MGKSIPEQNIAVQSTISGFILTRVQKIPELHSTAYIFSHRKTGARLLHLYNDDANNLFSIAFRTPVSDSTGVPHILEHSVLCGSKKFPLKDPFQELLKGSLQTFLNALTYPDKTVYPVSSQVEADFYNLVDVYCDAVFNPLLSENTFFQEGWHFDVEDISADVGIKGIVYNEMKGVFSNFSSHVERKTLSSLFPDTTYFHESGGEPEHITDLSYQQFRDFHRRYYHPSNSFIFLYGNIPSERTLSFLDTRYLDSFSSLEVDSAVETQQFWKTPVSVSIEAPAPKEEDGTATIALAWIFGDSTDPVSVLCGRIISHYLLGTESSPLKRALVDSGLGEDLDDICGFDSEIKQSVFAAGLRKSLPEKAPEVEKLILDTLRQQVQDGLDKELLEGSLRQVEFSLREITGSHFPFNLRLAERCYRSWIYDGDPLAHLAFEEPLSFIKEQYSSRPSFFADIIRKQLLENQHRLRSVIKASSEMGTRLEQQTEKHARELTKDFSHQDKERYFQLTKILLEQQKTSPSPSALATLPRLKKSDLPLRGREVPTEEMDLDGVKLYAHPLFTSGIVYFDISFDLRGVPLSLLPYLPVYSELITRCGAAGLSYEQTAKRIALSTGGVDSSVSCKMMIGDGNELFFRTFMHSKALAPRVSEMLDIISDLLLASDLTSRKQIKDILLEERNGLLSSVIGAGNSFAISRAAASLTESRYIDEQLGGISQLRFLDNLIKENNMEKIVDAVKQLHAAIVNSRGCVISLTADDPGAFIPQIRNFLSKLPQKEMTPVELPSLSPLPEKTLGIEINSAVNFVAQVWKLPGVEPLSAGLLYLMSRNLSTGYLWDKVRVEGGAYGGSSMMSISHPIFACSSYRDPNIKSTLDHFQKGIEEIASGIPEDKVEQSIIGTIGRIDSPLPPHSQGLGETVDLMLGNTREFKQKLREAVIGADRESLRSAASSVLSAHPTVKVVLGSGAALDSAQAQGVSMEREQLLR